MTDGPDPAPRRGFGRAFWAAMLSSLVLILAGAVVGFLCPRLFPAKPPPAVAPRLGNPAPPR